MAFGFARRIGGDLGLKLAGVFEKIFGFLLKHGCLVIALPLAVLFPLVGVPVAIWCLFDHLKAMRKTDAEPAPVTILKQTG